MKIYSCSPFYNELDILELRLRELYDHVDVFVIVEANTTYTSKPKHFVYEMAKARFKPWADKIRHIKVTDMPGYINPWENERYQRNQIMRGLYDAEPDDFVIVSDIDEIVRPEVVDSLRTTEEDVIGFKMPLFNFKFNYMMINQDYHNIWSMGCKRKILDEVEPEDLKHSRINFNNGGIPTIDHAGWHFTYLGDDAFVRNKIGSFSHSEVDIPEIHSQVNIEESIKAGLGYIRTATDYRYRPVKMDSYMPRTLTENLAEYQKWILPGAEESAIDFLPPWTYNKQ
jgi:hypothetical protein